MIVWVLLEIVYSIFIGIIVGKIASKIVDIVLQCRRDSDTKEWQQKTRRMAANSARVSGPMYLPCTVKLRSSALYRQVK